MAAQSLTFNPKIITGPGRCANESGWPAKVTSLIMATSRAPSVGRPLANIQQSAFQRSLIPLRPSNQKDFKSITK